MEQNFTLQLLFSYNALTICTTQISSTEKQAPVATRRCVKTPAKFTATSTTAAAMASTSQPHSTTPGNISLTASFASKKASLK